MGRRPFAASASPTWRALFDSSVPSERVLGPAHRLRLRIRVAKLGVFPTESPTPLSVKGRLTTVVMAIPEGQDAQDLGSASGDFASDPLASVAEALCSAPRWVGEVVPGPSNRWA